MTKILKYTALVIVAIVAFFILIVLFSTTEARYKCDGRIAREGSTEQLSVYIKITEYRPWVGLWSVSDGHLHLEIPNRWVQYFDRFDEVGDQLQIFTSYPQLTLKGNFSTLSNILALDTSLGFFDGTCSEFD